MFLKIFLGIIIVLALLACIGANERYNKRLAAVIAIATLVMFTVAMLNETGKEETLAAMPKNGTVKVEQYAGGTITVTDETGVRIYRLYYEAKESGKK